MEPNDSHQAQAGPSNQLDYTDRMSDDMQRQLNYMLDVIPDADPEYLQQKCLELRGIPKDIENFIIDVIEKRVKYPIKNKQRILYYNENYNAKENENLVQELLFLESNENVTQYLHEKKEEEKRELTRKQTEVQLAMFFGELMTCVCCCNEKFLCTDMSTCSDGHLFCKQCIRRHAETEIANGKISIKCIDEECEFEFTLTVLQDVLSAVTFFSFQQKKQDEELAAANITGLENCPFCSFSYIPPSHDKIFRCMNTNCLKQSCRECKKLPHIPLRCDETEKINDTNDYYDSIDYNIEENEQLSVKVQNQLTYLVSVLPEADIEYLKNKCIELIDKPKEMQAFILDALEKHEYPNIEEVNKKTEEDTMNKYLNRLSIKEFVEAFPDPENYFRSKTNEQPEYLKYSLEYLKDKFVSLDIDIINEQLQQTKNLVLSVERLTILNVPLNNVSFQGDNIIRKNMLLTAKFEERPCLPFLQEVFFLENRHNIKHYSLKLKEDEERKKFLRSLEFETAKYNRALLTCGCCFDEECLCSDMVTCPEGHLFCKECIRRYAENAIGDGKNTINCIENECNLEFTLTVLQNVLSSTIFSRLLQRKQSEEVAAAYIEGIESCPFCEFSLIPSPGDKIFRCLNPDCLKLSCRECKEPAHIPLRCNEVENDEQVKARKFVEERMTQGLIRECWRCHKKFVKTSGCNKMACTCGALMCYICRQPIRGYDHFKNGRCPLRSNTNEVHIRNVREEADRALEELKEENPDIKLKNDPTKEHVPTNQVSWGQL